jgi:hypothetical protein
MSLSEESLLEYQRLCVPLNLRSIPSTSVLTLFCSKAIANTQAVDERQSLQTLTRDERTSARALAGLQETHDRQEEKKGELETEAATLGERKAEVSVFGHMSNTESDMNDVYFPNIARRQSHYTAKGPEQREARAQ